LRCEVVIEHMTKKLDEIHRNIDRACATRDRLINGINDVKTRAQTREHQTKTPADRRYR
jgi:phage shock protein A